MTTRAFAFANLIGGDNKISLEALPDEATGGGDTLGTVNGSNIDLSTGSFFEVTANDQTLGFSNVPNVKDFKIKLTGAGTVRGYDLVNASYDNASFSFASQDVVPTDITFNNDGTKMYIVGRGTDTVHQYTLSPAWDISTASYDNVSFSVKTQDDAPTGITFNNDGTKMYMVGLVSVSVHQYTLSTAWDISTASYDSVAFDFSIQETFSAEALTFNHDGTKMYLVGRGGNTVHQYTLFPAWDISTASYDNISFSVATQDSDPLGIAFNNDGTKMYITGTSTNSVHQYTLSTPWDISTATYDSVAFDVSLQESFCQGVSFKPDGTKMFIIGSSSDKVWQYSTSVITNRTITYPNPVKFPSGTKPTDPAIGEVDILEFVTFDGGTTYYAYQLGDDHR